MSDKPKRSPFLQFCCLDCGAHIFDCDKEDPTTGSGACKTCGSDRYVIKDMQGQVVG